MQNKWLCHMLFVSWAMTTMMTLPTAGPLQQWRASKGKLAPAEEPLLGNADASLQN